MRSLSAEKFVRTYALATALLIPAEGQAQSVQYGPANIEIGAQAVGVVTRESPAIHGRDLTEGYLTQPIVMATATFWSDALEMKGTLNLEGATMKRGELNAGIIGEGYIDRRHPHTYLHELVITGQRRAGDNGASITLGKGFAPFGTDDPMARPFEKYPINHHLSQILERAVAIGALRSRRVIVEAGLFNGDEPESPGDVPNRARYWDSWSGRVTLVPFPQGELQTSYARVKSPENARGGGEDQHKQSASIRLEDAQHSGYGLLEWARTSDYVGSTRTFAFTSLLAETSARYGVASGALRLERTERPDEARLTNEFKTPLPANDLSITGRSRWTIITGRLAAQVPVARTLSFEPFAEVARIRFTPTLRPSGFDPSQFYGSDRIWSFSLGATLRLGMSHMRMGRYGVARTEMRGMKMDGMKMDGMHMHSDFPKRTTR
ncbi:MAG TPA: hypothetical protein VK478_12615 [Gemmatimonadaceae bacterium]|nr:hypothetical protein [Gemmatimonadaceae bacterium]